VRQGMWGPHRLTLTHSPPHAHTAGGVGVACIATPQDLILYGRALALAAPFIPADSLSCAPHAAITMPRFPPAAFMVQPWVAADHVQALPGRPPTVLGACVCVGVGVCGFACVCVCVGVCGVKFAHAFMV